LDPARTTEDLPRPEERDRGHRKELQVFNDIGALEVVTLVVLAVLVFGPDKLPKVIQDVTRTIRKIREFSDSAKADIRSELGPEFKDFDFEDLNPKTFLRKQLDNDDLGLKELRSGFDLKKEMAELTDAVHGRESESTSSASTSSASSSPASSSSATDSTSGGSSPGSSGGSVDMSKKREQLDAPERPPYDMDAT
jgi:sec-independent protein translocase protein TatB